MASQYFSRIKTVGFSLRLNSWLQLAIIFKFLSPDIKIQRLIIYVKELCCDHIELRRISYINNIHYVQFKYTLQICSNLTAFSLYSKMRNTTFYLAIRRYKSTISGFDVEVLWKWRDRVNAFENSRFMIDCKTREQVKRISLRFLS